MFRAVTICSFSAVSLAVLMLLVSSPVSAQQAIETQSQSLEVASSRNNKNDEVSAKRIEAKPLYTGFMGVELGMSADEVRNKLENLRDKGETQDFFVFSDRKSAQVFYDDQRKVKALSVDYVGNESEAPSPEKVMGEAVEAKPDGSMHALKRYPEAGYWIAYSRTGGENPITTVTMQRM